MPIRSSRSPSPFPPLAAAFRFTSPSGSIDWSAINHLDARQVIKDTDLDALETVLDSLAHGNLREAKGKTDFSMEAQCRLFEASQLALQYLLYVQDRLATELRSTKTELRSRRKELTNCHQTIFQLQRDLAAAEVMSSMLSNGVQDAPTPSKFQADGCKDKSGMCCPNPNVNAETQTSQRSLQLVDKETSFSQERYEEEFEQQSSPPIEQTSTATPPLSAASSPLSSSPHPHGRVLSHVTDDKENVGLRHETRDFQHRHSPNTHQCTLSQAYIRQLKRELPHELSGHDKQGVRGRFPHSISRVLSMRQEVKQEVDEELEKEFAQQGLRFSHSRGGNKTGLTSPEYKACMDALYCRRAAALQGMKIQEQERAEFMLNSVKAHVEDVARKQFGEALLQFYCPLAQNRSTAHRKL